MLVGWRTLLNRLGSTKCVNCGKEGNDFSVLNIGRACRDCWRCLDKGANGIEGDNKLAMCSLSWAKQEYLLTPSLLSRLPQMKIVDETKAHGTINSKMTITLVEEAKKLSLELWGEGGCETERTRRNAVSDARWQARCDEARLSGSKIPSQPKGFKPSPINYLAANQRCSIMRNVADIYGLYSGVINTKYSVKAPPSIIVTDHPQEHALLHPGVPCASNVFEALHDAAKPRGSLALGACSRELQGVTVLIDKRCYLPDHAKACSDEKKTFLCEDGVEVGGVIQKNCISVGPRLCSEDSVHLKGTERGSLVSDRAVLWVTSSYSGARTMIRLTDLTLQTFGTGITYCA